MTQEQLLLYLLENKYILKDGRTSPKANVKLKNDKTLTQTLEVLYPQLELTDVSFSEITYCIKHHIYETVTCKVCNSAIRFERSNCYYPTTCSRKCNAVLYNSSRFKENNPAKNPKILRNRADKKRTNFLLQHPELNNKKWLNEHHLELYFSIGEIASMLKVTYASVVKSLRMFSIPSPSKKELREASNIRKYGVKNVNELSDIRIKALTTLQHNRSLIGYVASKGEQELQDFIKTLLPANKIQQNTFQIIPPKELDIYLPDYNIAIEFCGLYWHSEKNGKDKWYHYNKWKACADKNIQLITIFEDEWKFKKKHIQAKIKNVLGKDDRDVVYARKTSIKMVSTSEKKTFFDSFHIQGNGIGSINIGLYHSNVLVACAGFMKTKNNKFYLNRYATSHRVVGGFSKIVAFFVTTYTPTEIISFADRRWSNGNVYEKNGWLSSDHLRPDYSYIRGNNRIHKFNYRRKNLPKLLKHFNPELSERENCDNNGILRIWDCGKYRYILPVVDI